MFGCGALKCVMHRYGEYIACDRPLNKNVCTVRRISVLTKDGAPSCRPDRAQLSHRVLGGREINYHDRLLKLTVIAYLIMSHSGLL